MFFDRRWRRRIRFQWREERFRERQRQRRRRRPGCDCLWQADSLTDVVRSPCQNGGRGGRGPPSGRGWGWERIIRPVVNIRSTCLWWLRNCFKLIRCCLERISNSDEERTWEEQFWNISKESYRPYYLSRPWEQCDQMAGQLFNIWPFATAEICPRALNFYKRWFKIHPKY